MNKEDLQFLKQLKEDIINGDHVGQAHPRFWMIKDYEEVAVPEYYGGEMKIVGEGEEYTLGELKRHLYETYKDEVDDQDEFRTDIDYCSNLEELASVIENYYLADDLEDYYEIYTEEKPFLSSQTGAFLTKEDAEAHLRDNNYHYSEKAHPYALTGWRNPRLEKLLDIILNNDWEE